MNASEFNIKYPVGTKIIYKDDLRKDHHSKTTTPAWVLGHGDSVIGIEGKRGGYSLDRVRVERPNNDE